MMLLQRLCGPMDFLKLGILVAELFQKRHVDSIILRRNGVRNRGSAFFLTD